MDKVGRKRPSWMCLVTLEVIEGPTPSSSQRLTNGVRIGDATVWLPLWTLSGRSWMYSTTAPLLWVEDGFPKDGLDAEVTSGVGCREDAPAGLAGISSAPSKRVALPASVITPWI
jgi:hypothetical protein